MLQLFFDKSNSLKTLFTNMRITRGSFWEDTEDKAVPLVNNKAQVMLVQLKMPQKSSL